MTQLPHADLRRELFPGTFRTHLYRIPQEHAFLKRVEELAPQVLRDLHDQVLPEFRTALDGNDMAQLGELEMYEWKERDWLKNRIRPLIRCWAEAHHLLPPRARPDAATGVRGEPDCPTPPP